MGDVSHRWLFATVVFLVTIGLLPLNSVSNSHGASPPKDGKWRVFLNRAGWKISFPPQWRVGSCHQCSDLTDPDALVTFVEPSTKAVVMIEHLADKPADKDDEQWLKEVSRDTVLNSQISEKWIVLDHQKALKVINGNAGSASSENIYVLYRQKTFAIRTSQGTSSYAICHRIISTFTLAP